MAEVFLWAMNGGIIQEVRAKLGRIQKVLIWIKFCAKIGHCWLLFANDVIDIVNTDWLDIEWNDCNELQYLEK